MHQPVHITVAQIEYLLAKAKSDAAPERVIQRLNCLLYYYKHNASATDTCRRFGISRNSFYRILHRFDPHDLSSLEDAPHVSHAQPTSLPKEAEAIIHKLRYETPHIGKEKIRSILEQEYGMKISSSAIGRFISREKLFFGDTPLHQRKRQHTEHDHSYVAPSAPGRGFPAAAHEWQPVAQPQSIMQAPSAAPVQHVSAPVVPETIHPLIEAQLKLIRTFLYCFSAIGVFLVLMIIAQLLISAPGILKAQSPQSSMPVSTNRVQTSFLIERASDAFPSIDSLHP